MKSSIFFLLALALNYLWVLAIWVLALLEFILLLSAEGNNIFHTPWFYFKSMAPRSSFTTWLFHKLPHSHYYRYETYVCNFYSFGHKISYLISSMSWHTFLFSICIELLPNCQSDLSSFRIIKSRTFICFIMSSSRIIKSKTFICFVVSQWKKTGSWHVGLEGKDSLGESITPLHTNSQYRCHWLYHSENGICNCFFYGNCLSCCNMELRIRKQVAFSTLKLYTITRVLTTTKICRSFVKKFKSSVTEFIFEVKVNLYVGCL